MQRCHNCGKDFHDHDSVVRSVKTGVYTGGADYFRNVNLCCACAEEMTRLEQGQRNNKTFILLAAVVVVLATAGYVLFFR